MKRTLLFILCTILLVSCFTACKENHQPETAPDVLSASTVASTVAEDTDAEDQPVDETAEKQAVPNKTTAGTSQKQAEKTAAPTTKETKKEAAVINKTEKEKNTASEQEDAACAVKEFTNPTFGTEEELKNWLVNGNGNHEEERTAMLNSLQNNNSVTYYRSKMRNHTDYFLSGGHIGTTGYIHYVFQRTDQVGSRMAWWYAIGIDISVAEDELELLYKEEFNFIKEQVAQGIENYYSETVNGIEYVFIEDPSRPGKETFVVWEQFGFYHRASFCRELDEIYELLPYLELETVTVNTDPDHVTQ